MIREYAVDPDAYTRNIDALQQKKVELLLLSPICSATG